MPTKRQLVVWLSDEERQTLKDRAAQNILPDGRAMSVSAYIRMLIHRDENRTPTQE